MPTFDYHFEVAAPVQAVGMFHQDARTLSRLTPPPIFVQMHKVELMAEGSISEFTLWFGPLPSCWVAVHTNIDPQHGFTDRQARGPLKQWQHSYRFMSRGENRTAINEHIEYEYVSGLWGLFSRLFFSPPMLWLLFGYWQFVIRKAFREDRV